MRRASIRSRFFFDVKQKGSLDFSKEIKVTVEDFTTFGNDVWVEKILTPADFGTALTIDSYGRKLKKYSPESIICFARLLCQENLPNSLKL